MSFVSRRFAAFPASPTFVSRPQTTRRKRVLTFRVHDRDALERPRVESFVDSIYSAHYGAKIPQWMPWLATVEDGASLVAAAGYRRASDPLFLEHYLSAPVNEVLATAAGIVIDRDAVFEVGHFASARVGAGRRLMIALGRHLTALGCRWVVSTATVELRVLFDRIGLRTVVLGPANAAALGRDATCWGTYYEHAPAVIAGELAPSLAALRGCT